MNRIKKMLLLGLMLTGISTINNRVAMQKEDPRIVQDRRGVFIPIINDALFEGVNPFAYNIGSKLKKVVPNLLFGREHKVEQRDDAWRLYLGKPQLHNTFSISEHSPVGSKEVCYKINDFFDRYLAFGKPEDQIKTLHGIIKAEGNITYGDFNVMGGYSVGISKDEKEKSFLFYHDVWDLNVPIERNRGFFGKPFTLYDKLYFDERTYEPERQLKPASSLDDLERM